MIIGRIPAGYIRLKQFNRTCSLLARVNKRRLILHKVYPV